MNKESMEFVLQARTKRYSNSCCLIRSISSGSFFFLHEHMSACYNSHPYCESIVTLLSFAEQFIFEDQRQQDNHKRHLRWSQLV